MLKKLFIFVMTLIVIIGGTNMSNAQINDWDKTFPQSDKVNVKKVSFKNRYGITLVGDLYTPKNKTSEQMAAIAVAGPFGAVKEQASGLYAQTMA